MRDFPKFAFINFKSSDAVLQALKADGMVEISGNNLHVEERRPRGQAETYNLQQLDSFWNDLVRNFDWRRSAAVYVLRKWTMEDFLRDFIVTYACAREVNDESVDALLNKLVKMSETKPESLQETLPPNLSGMIYNLVHEGKSDSKKKFVGKFSLADLANLVFIIATLFRYFERFSQPIRFE